MLNADGIKGNNIQRDLKFREKTEAKAEGKASVFISHYCTFYLNNM